MFSHASILLVCIVSIVVTQSLGVCIVFPCFPHDTHLKIPCQLLWTEISEEFPAPAEVVIGCRLILNLRSSLVRDKDEEGHIQVDTPLVVFDPLSSSTLLE